MLYATPEFDRYQVNSRLKSQQDAFIARLLYKNLDSSLYFN